MLQLPTDLSRSIQALIATGRYATEEDVLREALVVLQQRDEDHSAIAAGIEDMEQGRYRPFSEFDAEFRDRHGISRSA